VGIILVEGPDKCGKTTLVNNSNLEKLHLPNGVFRDLLLKSNIEGTAATFLFFANEMQFWQDWRKNPIQLIADRGMLSMLVYQGYLLGNMPPLIILNLYKSIVKPEIDEIIYLTNTPFEEYDKNDPFEAYGYDQIREAYHDALGFVKANMPEIKITMLDLKWQH